MKKTTKAAKCFRCNQPATKDGLCAHHNQVAIQACHKRLDAWGSR